MNTREKTFNRARSFSKRHDVKVTVHLVTRGRGKGFFFDTVGNDPVCLKAGCASEVVAVYRNGIRLK